MARIRVGLIGVGNIAAFLVQAVEYYKKTGSDEGLIHRRIGKYNVEDIEFVYAVDVSKNKVGKDLAEAIFEHPNKVPRFVELNRLGVTVRPGKVLDGVAPHMVEDFNPIEDDRDVEPETIAKDMTDAGVDVVINLLPVGSEEASRFYAKAAALAGAAFVNAIPTFIASSPNSIRDMFAERKTPLLGDDIKGQLGSTIVHRALAYLIRMRGAKLLETYQLNVGGNSDFKNMLLIERLDSKKISKTMAVAVTQPNPEALVKEGLIHAGPSGYVEFLGNTKVSYIYIKAKAFAGSFVEIDLKLKVDDKAMASAVLVDVIRLAKILREHEIGGAVEWASAFYFKHPPINPRSDYEALKALYEGLERLGEKAEPNLLEYY